MYFLGVSEEYPVHNQDLFTWAGGQFVHHMFISWWLLARFAKYDEDWAQSNHSVSLRGVVTKRCTFPPEVSTLRLHVLDVSSNSLETLPKGLEYFTVSHLNLENNDIGKFDFSQGYESLTYLDLSRNPITEAKFSSIHETQLETLVVRFNKGRNPKRIMHTFQSCFQSLTGLKNVLFLTYTSSKYERASTISKVATMNENLLRSSGTTVNPFMGLDDSFVSVDDSQLAQAELIESIDKRKEGLNLSNPENASWEWLPTLPSYIRGLSTFGVDKFGVSV